MALPSKPKTDPRPKAVTVRLSEKVVQQLQFLAKEHNLSQADVIEHLVIQEYKAFQAKKK